MTYNYDRFVKSMVWKYAKTMPKWPHWYCLLVNCKTTEDRDHFFMLVKDIFTNGYDVTIGKRTYRYLDIGKFKYWSMDPTIESTDLINRAYIDGRTVPDHERTNWINDAPLPKRP